MEYRVAHPPWQVWARAEGEFSGDGAALYGDDFGRILQSPPASAQIAVGSPIQVYPGEKL